MRKLRILHTNMHHAWGGQPNRILTTAAGLRARGHHVCVLAPRGAETIQRARAQGIAVFEDVELARGFHPASLWRDVRKVRQHLRAEKYDIIDTHGSQDSWVVHFALMGFGATRPPIVRTRHNTFPVAKHLLNRWLYSRVAHIITISPQVIPLLKGLVPPGEFTAIYSAPDPGRFQIEATREEVRAELGYAPEHQVIGVVGRLAPEKGHDVLLAAAPAILAAHPNARFLFVGTGRSRPAIEAQAGQLGISNKLQLTGFRKDVPRLHKAMDLFALTPVSGESLGTSILEAFLSELPVVATDVGGVCESVRNGETGLLVPPGAPKPLAAAIIEMLNDPGRAREMALAGKALVQHSFTPEMIAEKTEAVYQRVLDRARKG